MNGDPSGKTNNHDGDMRRLLVLRRVGTDWQNQKDFSTSRPSLQEIRKILGDFAIKNPFYPQFSAKSFV
jgi:hypothetical protein